MSPRRAYNHRDANEPELVKAAERLGVWCVEGGPLDFWAPRWRTVWFPGQRAVSYLEWVPVEVKNPGGRRKPGQKGEFRRKQLDFIAECQRRNLPYAIWRTLEDVIAFAQARQAPTRVLQ